MNAWLEHSLVPAMDSLAAQPSAPTMMDPLAVAARQDSFSMPILLHVMVGG